MTPPNLAIVHDEPVGPVERLWAVVFRCSGIVIVHAQKHGFMGMHEPNPNIFDLLVQVGMLDGAVDALEDDPEVSIDEMRKLLNAQKQLKTLRKVAKALQQGKQEEFEAAMRDLETQAPF